MLLWDRIIVIIGRPARTAVCIFILYCLFGCWSPKAAIDSKASEVGQLATLSGERFTNIGELATSSEARFVASGNSEGILEQQEIISESGVGLDEQIDIVESASGIRSDLQGVEDTVPWWAVLTGQALWVVGGVAVLIFLWRSGLLGLIRGLIWGVGLFIPKRSVREAELDFKILHSDNGVTIRESVAAKRASDPSYAAAYEKVKVKRSLKNDDTSND